MSGWKSTEEIERLEEALYILECKVIKEIPHGGIQMLVQGSLNASPKLLCECREAYNKWHTAMEKRILELDCNAIARSLSCQDGTS